MNECLMIDNKIHIFLFIYHFCFFYFFLSFLFFFINWFDSFIKKAQSRKMNSLVVINQWIFVKINHLLIAQNLLLWIFTLNQKLRFPSVILFIGLQTLQHFFHRNLTSEQFDIYGENFELFFWILWRL